MTYCRKPGVGRIVRADSARNEIAMAFNHAQSAAICMPFESVLQIISFATQGPKVMAMGEHSFVLILASLRKAEGVRICASVAI